MPLQINEIVIRAVVGNNSSDKQQDDESKSKIENIVRECVEQVIEILKEKAER